MAMVHDAILGRGIPSHEIGQQLVDAGLARYTGGFRDDYDWDAAAVHRLPLADALDIYERLVGRK